MTVNQRCRRSLSTDGHPEPGSISRRAFLGAASAALVAHPLHARPVTATGTASILRTHAAAQAFARPVPTSAQLTWQQDELALFIHFGINTYTDREWGDGREDPRLFAPGALDCRQWARAARAGGFRALVLTAKHHDGFCLWPSRTTTHSVAHSAWREGGGDVVREFVDACRAEGLRAGLYCSPWDRHEPSYGDSPRYNDLYVEQLTELLTRYGPIHEVWFDGANGEGPNGRRQEYDWPRFWALVRRLQPDAVIFSDAGPDVRWIGNEQGVAGDPNWSTVDPSVVPVPGTSGAAALRSLQHGDPAGTVWRPGEADVSIRPGWFYHAAEDARVKTADQLVDLYHRSVGRNAKLLLNVPPTANGLLHETDSARLEMLYRRLTALFENDLAANRSATWHAARARTAIAEVDLGRAVSVGIVDLREDIAHGQAIARYVVEGLVDGAWRTLSRGTTIGYRKLDRFAPIVASRVRVRIEEAIDTIRPIDIRLYAGSR